MSIVFTDTRTLAVNNGIKVLTHGRSGAGKTKLIDTLPGRTMIGSAEKGTLSVAQRAHSAAILSSRADLDDFYQWCLNSNEVKNYDNIALDSISEMAEKFLYHEKHFAKNKDVRAAYGEMQDKLWETMRNFRDLPRLNVYLTAKSELRESTSGMKLWSPMLPGGKASAGIPYYFDLCLYLGIASAPDPNKPGEMMTWRFLQTSATAEYEAKDRSGILDPVEPPDLGAIFAKIRAHILSVNPAQTSAVPTMAPPPFIPGYAPPPPAPVR